MDTAFDSHAIGRQQARVRLALWCWGWGLSLIFCAHGLLSGVIVSGALISATIWSVEQFGRISRAHGTLASTTSIVLYLRPFNREKIRFDSGRRLRLAAMIQKVFLPWVRSGTFDQSIVLLVERQLGPLVAIGDPRDTLPPAGAARIYVRHDQWKDEIPKLIPRCIAVFVMAGHTPGIAWELSELRLRFPGQKIFVFTSSSPASETEWEAVRTTFSTCGWQLPVEYPGPNSVIGFHDNFLGDTLVRKASTPRELVEPIVSLLNEMASPQSSSAQSLDSVPSNAPDSRPPIAPRPLETFSHWLLAVFRDPTSRGWPGLIATGIFLTVSLGATMLMQAFVDDFLLQNHPILELLPIGALIAGLAVAFGTRVFLATAPYLFRRSAVVVVPARVDSAAHRPS